MMSNYNFRIVCRAVLAYLLLPTISSSVYAVAPNILPLDSPSVSSQAFGWAVDAAAGKIVAAAEESGNVFIYDERTRHELFRLQASDSNASGHAFGWSAAINANHAIVGTNNGQVAYVFNAATGQQVARFAQANGVAFGTSVGLNGATAIVGDYAATTGFYNSGALYKFDIATGFSLGTILPPNPAPNQLFGLSFDTSSTYLVVGAPGANGTGNNTGAAYVYNPNGGYLRTLVPTNASNDFGWDVKVFGNRAIVSDVGANNAAVYLFDLDTGAQIRKFVSPNLNQPYFGDGIDFDGQRVLIGNWAQKVGAYGNAGTAYMFDAASGNLLATLLSPDNSFNFGHSVALDGGFAVVGAPFGNGRVFVVEVPEPTSVLTGLIGSLALLFIWPRVRRWPTSPQFQRSSQQMI